MLDVKQEAMALQPELVRWRRALHRIPEVHTDLKQTSAYICGVLEELGLEYRVFSNLSVKTVLRGAGDGPVLGLRADMDGLPVAEETGLPFASENGSMHACGHDAHAAMLLGVVKVLSQHRDAFRGSVVCLFQSAEETTGGARDIIAEGCLEDPHVDRFFSLHIGSLFPGVETGQFGVRKGPMMASVDSYYVKVHGVGGHGARPHECVDPIVVMAEMITALQTLVSREINPVHGAVVTVGLIKAGTIVNVIPSEGEFAGTIRTLDPADRAHITRRMKELIPRIAPANRATAEVEVLSYYPPTVNDGAATDFLAACAAKVLGPGRVVEIPEPSTGTEDVAYYLEAVPGSFGVLGSWKAHSDGVCYPHHNSKFLLDESVFWMGSAVFLQCALDFCGSNP